VHSRRTTVRRAGILTATAALVVGAVMTWSTAHATPTTPKNLSASAVAATASRLKSALGDDDAGSYLERGRLVVDVTDSAAARKVEAAGGVARPVTYGAAELDSAKQTLKEQATVPGTAWVVDPRGNRVVVTADRTVTGTRLTRVTRTVASLGARATLKRTTGLLRPLVAGGDAIYASGARCSLGFNVVKGGEPYFLTAGHCGNYAASWSDTSGGPRIGQVEDSRFPGDDFAIVRYTATVDHPSAVDLHNGGSRAITSAADATVGESVQRSGSTTGVHSGQVLGVDATVNYAEGTVEGLIDANVCAEPGDSGGSLFDGSTALGLTSGGIGDCASGGETFFQPVPEALSAEGAEIG
jgi:streptogrisin D